MRVTTKGQYGLSFMIELAKLEDGKPIPLRVIAQKLKISEPYLEQIIILLKKGTFLKSTRGVNGGYLLAKKTEEITAYEILNTVESHLDVVESETDADPDFGKQYLFEQLQNAVTDVLQNVTLKDLVERSSGEQDNYMYFI
ncbi:MAG TPA: Rrf2 family transcriptional regulator [Firmicutes bacterium]|nr:Rrf2 family transcriptional regulator [Bacillales bacterium]HJA41241.1 Rrf2 family transcriptional regulator [Bacillota bacterium]